MTKWDRSVMTVNVPHEVLTENIRANIQRQHKQHRIFSENPQHIAIVGGGWSLPETYDELCELYHDGVKLVALNGAANWLMERNLRPSMHVMLDAKDHDENRAFFSRDIPGCKYFIASQCHPSIFDTVKGRDVTIFHALADEGEADTILDAYYAKRWVRTPSAGSVGLVAIMLCRQLGFQWQHLFGIDSCYKEDQSHPWPQEMNEGEGTAMFFCAGRTFRCSAWQASQASTFIDIVKAHGDQINLSVHGDGLIAHMLQTGAQLKEAA